MGVSRQCFWEMNNSHLSEKDILEDDLEKVFDRVLIMHCCVGPGTRCELRMKEDLFVQEVKQVREEVV